MYVYFSQNRKNSQNVKSMRVPVLVYLILSQNLLHDSLQKLILRFVAGLLLQLRNRTTIDLKYGSQAHRGLLRDCNKN